MSNNETTVEKLKRALIPSAFAGVISVGGYYFLVDSDLTRPLPFLNMQVPTWAAVGVSSAVGGIAGSLVADFVMPYISQNQTLNKIEDMVLPPVAAGLGTVAAMKFMIDQRVELWPSFLVGAVGEVGGKYVYNYFY